VAVTNVRAAKHTHAVAKILAAVGQVLSRYSPANRAGVEIELGILLPLDEVSGDLSLSDRISQHLYGFGHNGQRIQGVIVKAVAISPEGYGYALAASKSPAGILLFGHRDLAYREHVILFERKSH
jgi:hypothetical protein